MFWVPGVISAVIDNVPIAALLSPLAATFAGMSSVVVLALISGVNVGAFILPIGSPANIIALALSETEKDPIGIMGFAKIATPMAILMMLVGTGYLLVLTLLI
jgi:Na+/H+ antiporter NhaD/arsenite permease-like protein